MILPMAKDVPSGAGEFHLPSADQPFICGTVAAPVGRIPRVDSELTRRDLRGHYLVRWNIGRDYGRQPCGLDRKRIKKWLYSVILKMWSLLNVTGKSVSAAVCAVWSAPTASLLLTRARRLWRKETCAWNVVPACVTVRQGQFQSRSERGVCGVL